MLFLGIPVLNSFKIILQNLLVNFYLILRGQSVDDKCPNTDFIKWYLMHITLIVQQIHHTTYKRNLQEVLFQSDAKYIKI